MAEQLEVLKEGDRVSFTDQKGNTGYGIVSRKTKDMTLILPDPGCGLVTEMKNIKKVHKPEPVRF